MRCRSGRSARRADRRHRRRRDAGAAAALAFLACIAAAFVAGRLLSRAGTEPITITRLTFDRGVIRSARFAPDQGTIVYGARWGGEPLQMYVARADTAESKPLDLPNGDVLAVSATGDMLLSLGRRYLTSWTSEGTLARALLFGSSAREVLEHVRDADFLPGDRLAIARRENGRDRLEVPQGTVAARPRATRIGDLNGNAQPLVERQRSSPKSFGERLSLEILHDEKLNGLAARIGGIRRRTDVIERADVRMGQCRDREGFALQTPVRDACRN